MSTTSTAIPVIDIGDLNGAHGAAAIDAACRTSGFFAIRADAEVDAHRGRVIEAARQLFALPIESKRRAALATGGTAWRGWFPLGDELTSGVPDLKEGFYVGREEPPDPRPLHGPNVWPAELPELRLEVSSWMRRMETLAQRALAAMAVGLGLAPDHFVDDLTHEPTVLFRIFVYPPQPPTQHDRWGVAEHSDYGLLTLLAHDGTPGLQVRVENAWIDVDPDPQLIICNIGDMLDRLTGGRYCSTPHRVRNVATNDRISLPFFLDPAWTARVDPLPLIDQWTVPADRAPRWDRTNLGDVSGTYGDWLIAKVRQVFPQLASTVLEDLPANDL